MGPTECDANVVVGRRGIVVAAMPRISTLALLALLPALACLQPGSYACDGDTQCRARDGGACVDGYCAYPDDDCDSLLRYGPYAAGTLAGACVPTLEPTTGSTTAVTSEGGSSGSDDGSLPPVAHCGNGVIDEGEDCDDGNRDAGDSCPPQCAASGSILWTVTYDGEAHSEDRGFGMAIDPDGDTFWVAGFTTVDVTHGHDMLLQRRWIEDGSLVWTRNIDGDAHVDDHGENVAIDAEGRPWLVGQWVTGATAGDVWVGSFERDGSPRASFTYDEQGGDDHGHGIAVTASGELAVVGTIDLGATPDAPDAALWLQRYDGNGVPTGEAVVRNPSTSLDIALQVVSDGDALFVTGDLSDDAGVEQVWTARYDADDTLVWEGLGNAADVGPYPRGVGIAKDVDGGCGIAGVLSADMWIQRYAADGTPGLNLVVTGDADGQDEAADIAFLPDGRFIVVGFLDFATVGFATGDAWVRLYQPDGTPAWTDVYDGPSEEIDKALAVGLTAHDSAIVVGYETVPGQSRDVWMRHYAL